MTTANKGIEIQGKTIESAIESGLEELGLERRQVQIEVVKPGSRGVLGIGAEDAVVRLTPRSEDKAPATAAPEPEASEVDEPALEVPEADTVEEAPVVQEASVDLDEAAEESPAVDAEALELASELLGQLLHLLGVKAKVIARETETAESEEPSILLDVQGKDLGVLIGRRGETLASLQFLVRLMVNNHIRRWVNVIVDVEGYKARRERMLKELALRMAERAISTGRVVSLEAMPARERRIIHIALRHYEGVTTQSVGEGDSRKVTIIPD